MPAQSSYHTVAEQIITFNGNVVNMLANINKLISSSSPYVVFNITNQSGVVGTYSLPSMGHLQSEIDRLNNNINSIYNISNSGSLIQSSNTNVYQKVVVVDLNIEPNDIGALPNIKNFFSLENSFFDNLIDPQLFVELDLSGQINTINVSSILSQRFIIQFDQDSSGNYTSFGQSAINSFNTLFRGINNISYNAFQLWYTTTPGITNPSMPIFEEKIYQLDPNNLLYDGTFTTIKTEQDTVNNILWYVLDRLTYVNTQTLESKQLSVGDQLIINQMNSTTRYSITNISKAASNPMVSLQRIEGNQPIPIGVGTLKIYSPVLYTQKVNIVVGYNERCVCFIKAINSNNNILSKNWSLGIGFWTNDLSLSSKDSYNGTSMQQYYTTVAQDYGIYLKDAVKKHIPVPLSIPPSPPTLIAENFKVVQTNIHLTDTPDSSLILAKHSTQTNLKSQVDQLNGSIQSKNKEIKVTRFTSDAAKTQASSELSSLHAQHASITQLLNSTTSDIINLSNSTSVGVKPKYAVRGFWTIPSPSIAAGTNPQQVIQFNVEYRRLSADGKEAPIHTFKINDANIGLSASKVASFSNWKSMKTQSLKRIYDKSTGQYSWSNPDISNPDSHSINSLDIPIEYNEQIEIRISSISEAGWPDSPVISDWSNTISIPFPKSLLTSKNNTKDITAAANNQHLLNTVQTNYSAKGLDSILSQVTVVNNNTYTSSSDVVLSGFTDANGVATSLKDHIQSLMDTISKLQDAIINTKGVLNVVMYQNSQQFAIQNGTNLTFNLECEDYLDPFTSTGVPTGRVYTNNIYVIKDFLLQIQNTSVSSPLGLLSNLTYLSGANTNVYNSSTPQVFWVDNHDELIVDNSTAQTKTQIDNQFIWMVNYASVNQTTVTKLSEDIGNSFANLGNNSITNVLSSTDFNIGYSQEAPLNFVGNNNSLMDTSKWIDTSSSISSTTRLLTTIHPQVQTLSNIVETNSQKVHNLNGGSGNYINIPINIYFKMNALDSSQSGLNYQYINLNGSTQTVKHTKELKFLLQNQASSVEFIFTVTFNINRSKIVMKKNISSTPTQLISGNNTI